MTSYVVPHTLLSAATVRHHLVDDLAHRDVPPDVVDDAALVMSELVGNAVRHGAPLAGGGLRVAWEVGDHELHLEVQDGGCGPTGQVGSAPASAESGRGLAIVELLAERWGTTPTYDGGMGVYADLSLGVAVASNAERRLDRG